MTRYTFIGRDVLEQIESLPADLYEQTLESLEELAVDPENKRNDWQSTVQPYKDARYGHTYSFVPADGLLLVYTVYQDYPKVWLRRLIRLEDEIAKIQDEDES